SVYTIHDFEWTDDNSTVPPTTHDNPHPDRLRMVRSMRKLTAVLGETPVVETASPPPHLLTPKRSFFFHASASLSSLLSRSKNPTPPPRPNRVPHSLFAFRRFRTNLRLSPRHSPRRLPPHFRHRHPQYHPSKNQSAADCVLAKVSRTLGETTFALAVQRRPTLNVGANKVIKRAIFSPDTVSPPEAVGWLRRASRAILNVEQDRQPVTFADDATSPTGLPPTYEESHQHGPTRAETSPASSSQAEGMRRQEVEWTGSGEECGQLDDVVRNLRGLKLK
ncbi:hypothetical protein R3P38DRAFT_2970302, partial [Favolaschia claudopus]